MCIVCFCYCINIFYIHYNSASKEIFELLLYVTNLPVCPDVPLTPELLSIPALFVVACCIPAAKLSKLSDPLLT
jgi:hypothetical protein